MYRGGYNIYMSTKSSNSIDRSLPSIQARRRRFAGLSMLPFFTAEQKREYTFLKKQTRLDNVHLFEADK